MWVLSNPLTATKLERLFTQLNIPLDAPGFQNEPSFIAQEFSNPRFLEKYANFVESRYYSETYLQQARRKIDVAAEAVRAAVAKDGRLGACVDTSGMLGVILDRLGVWNYVAKATLTISFPGPTKLGPRHFWAFDANSVDAPHAIVVAPPYYVIDLTVRQQAYDAAQTAQLPPAVLTDAFEATTWDPEDLANGQIRARLDDSGESFHHFLQRRNPAMAEVIAMLPPRRTAINGTQFKYVVVAVAGYSEPLEKVVAYNPCGRTALQIYDQDIAPKFA